MTRRCACGNLTQVRDYDEPAIREGCQDEITRDIDTSPWNIRFLEYGAPGWPFATDDQNIWSTKRWWAVRTGWHDDGYTRNWDIQPTTVGVTHT